MWEVVTLKRYNPVSLEQFHSTNMAKPESRLHLAGVEEEEEKTNILEKLILCCFITELRIKEMTSCYAVCKTMCLHIVGAKEAYLECSQVEMVPHVFFTVLHLFYYHADPGTMDVKPLVRKDLMEVKSFSFL